MLDFNKKAFLYLAAIVAGFALIELSGENVGDFFESLFFYVGVIAMAFFSFVLIFFASFSFFNK